MARRAGGVAGGENGGKRGDGVVIRSSTSAGARVWRGVIVDESAELRAAAGRRRRRW